jgi:hypothetical protein
LIKSGVETTLPHFLQRARFGILIGIVNPDRINPENN